MLSWLLQDMGSHEIRGVALAHPNKTTQIWSAGNVVKRAHSKEFPFKKKTKDETELARAKTWQIPLLVVRNLLSSPHFLVPH